MLVTGRRRIGRETARHWTTFGGRRIVAKATAVAPGDVLKVYMYGYLNRVRSSGPFLKPIVKHCEAIN